MKPQNRQFGIRSILIQTPDKANEIELLEIKGFIRKGKTDSLSFNKQVRLECDNDMKTWFRVVVANESSSQIVGCGIKEKKVEVGGDITFGGVSSGNHWTVVCYPLGQGVSEVAPKDVVITVEGTTAKPAPAAKPPKPAGKRAEAAPAEGGDTPNPRPSKLIEETQTVVQGSTALPAVASAARPEIKDDFNTLAGCEVVIERGLRGFIAMGKALSRIRDGELYKPAFATFEKYCQKRWSRSLREVNKIIGATEVYEALSAGGVKPPTSQDVLSLLARLPREKLESTWTKATELAGGEVVTTKMVLTVSHTSFPPKKRPNADAFFRLIGRLDDALPLVGPAARKQIKAALDERPEAEAHDVVSDFLELCTKLLGLASWLQQRVKGAKPPKVRSASKPIKPRGASFKVKTS